MAISHKIFFFIILKVFLIVLMSCWRNCASVFMSKIVLNNIAGEMAGSRKEKFACDKGIFIPCNDKAYEIITIFLRYSYEFLTNSLRKAY